MSTDNRRAKVTPETKEESRRLKEIWDRKRPSTQAEFGEAHQIGNQSAVGQFLRGAVPLSLKAARGFALGLGCRIEDFSPRLAAEAAAISNMVPGEHLDQEVAALAADINRLPKKQRDVALQLTRQALLAVNILGNEVPQSRTVAANGNIPASPKRAKRRH